MKNKFDLQYKNPFIFFTFAHLNQHFNSFHIQFIIYPCSYYYQKPQKTFLSTAISTTLGLSRRPLGTFNFSLFFFALYIFIKFSSYDTNQDNIKKKRKRYFIDSGDAAMLMVYRNFQQSTYTFLKPFQSLKGTNCLHYSYNTLQVTT